MDDGELTFLRGGGEMGARIRAMDWESSELGHPRDWPKSLKTCVRIVLTSRQAMFVWWGKNLINIYNDAYKSIVGGKHPEALGLPASVVWREIWDQVGPRASQTMAGDEGTYDEALLLIMERHGYQEETYYTFSYSPVPGDEGGTGGLICANTDDTRRIIGERQVALLRDLAARAAEARTLDDVGELTAASLATDPKDLPFALVYLIDPQRRKVRLASAVGLEEGSPAAPARASLGDRSVWPFLEGTRPGEMFLVEDLSSLGPLPTGGWPKAPTRAVLFPIAPSGATGESGILIVGLNPYRRFDEDYRGFLAMVAGQISASVANAQAYEREKQRAESLAEIDRVKTAFFSNVSHELRTPLTLMLGPTEDALASDPPVLTGENLRAVHRNELRLLKLVNTLLDFSRIEAGRQRANYRETELGVLTRDLASAFRAAIEQAGLTFVVESPSLAKRVFVDHDMWEKIVLNLLSNALKFTFEGRIVVRLEERDERVDLTIEDTGVGIPEGELPHLFERFHRVQGVKARTHEGSGIGLALVSELVRLHGGTIAVRSTVGTGTIFTISIPLGSTHLPQDQVGDESSRSSTPVTVEAYVSEVTRWLPEEGAGRSDTYGRTDVELGTVPVERNARIVVADDNADMREYVTRLLQPHWRVDAFPDGRSALEAIRKAPPSLVLTDVMMPELDGFGLLTALRSSDETRRLPVIMLSARAGEEARVDGLVAGADDYLVKPFSARELLARVATHLQIAQLRESAESERRKLDELIAQAPVAIALFTGPELRHAVANAQYLDMVGRAEVVGETLRAVFPELGEHQAISSLEDAYRLGETRRVNELLVPLVRAGRSREAYFDYVARPISEGGQTIGVLVVAVEVTEKVAARQRIEALRAAAVEASRAKDEFLSTLSHELRTPLNAIVGWSSLLRAHSVPPARVDHALETIERNARLQARLIEDLLDLSRIEQGKLVLSVGPVEMVKVVEAAIEAVRPACDAKGVRLQPVLDSHATIVGDPDRLQQVVWNLLSNAMKFTPKDGRVQIALRRAQSYVELCVTDTGQGIDPSFLPHVFDRFRQGDASTVRMSGGLGLGLAIARSLVELHGGTISARSDGPGKGASFTVRLPTAPIRSESAPAARDEEPVPKGTIFECPPALEGLRVLVVDDEPETRELLRFVLEQCQAHVTTAGSAAQAMDTFQRGTFDMIMSDVGMPGEDGYSLLRRIRSLPADRGGAVPALALTAYARSEDRMQALRAGFDMHMAKPIDPGELLVIVDRLVARYHPRRR